MAAQTRIHCDTEGCAASYTTPTSERSWARLDAEQEGWHCSEYGDLCPTCNTHRLAALDESDEDNELAEVAA